MLDPRPFLIAALVPLLSAAGPPPRTAASQQAEDNAPARPVRIALRVRQTGGGLGVFVDEAAVFSEVQARAGSIWVVERRRRDQRVGTVTYRYEWIDGRTCPALSLAIAALAHLPPVSFAGGPLPTRSQISDTPEVTVMGPPANGVRGDLLLRRDLSGVVSRWWWDSSKTLEACWQARQPYIRGAYDLVPRLDSIQREVEVMRTD